MSYKNIVKLTCSAALLASSISAYATYKDAPPLLQSNWEFHVAPYLWALNMDGTTQIGATRAHIDESFNDILSHMDFGGMIWLEADKDRFGIFMNALYAVLSDTAQDGIVDLDAKSHFGLFSGGFSYRFPISTKLSLIPYVGARYTLNNNSLKASIPGITINRSKNEDWVDPIVGLRLKYEFTRAWSLLLAGDVGGTSGTDKSYDLMGLLGYNPQTMWTNTTTYVGYRQLKQYYQTGSGTSLYVWNMRIAGPLVGIDIKF